MFKIIFSCNANFVIVEEYNRVFFFFGRRTYCLNYFHVGKKQMKISLPYFIIYKILCSMNELKMLSVSVFGIIADFIAVKF